MPISRRPHRGIFTLVRQVLQAICTLAAATSLLAHAGETTNRIGITMVDIPEGSFMMGSCKVPTHEASRIAEENKKRAFLGQPLLSTSLNCSVADSEAFDNETPQHRVSIRQFQLGKTEVTLGQFKQYITAANRSDLVDDDFMKYNSNGDNAPVMQVSWNDAQGFITWLNKTDGGGYRLPSEAEWEYACRAGGNHTYCGSNSVRAVAWVWDNSAGRAQAVATKQANAFGLFDMSGNGWEWVEDCRHVSYSGAPTDGSAWTDSCLHSERVQRGGSWNNAASSSRAADRGSSAPSSRVNTYGLRLARTR